MPNSHGMTSEKSTVIPRPVTKRQFSSPASYGVAHINLSDVVAKINSGPKSCTCTNPFRNGLLSQPDDTNSNRIGFNDTLNPYSGEASLYTQVIDEKSQKNPFRRQQHEPSDDQPFFLFPSNGNIKDISSTVNYDSEHTDTAAKLIELDEDETEAVPEMDNGNNCRDKVNDEEVQKLVQIATTTSDSPTFSNDLTHVTNSPVHNRSLSDSGSKIPNTNQSEQQLKTNPFDAAQHLHKTLSDTYLEKYSMKKSPQHSHPIERTPSRQSIDTSSSNDPTNNLSTPSSLNESEMKRAVSCESINSESSVLLGDLEPTQTVYPSVTGQICVGLQYDK